MDGITLKDCALIALTLIVSGWAIWTAGAHRDGDKHDNNSPEQP